MWLVNPDSKSEDHRLAIPIDLEYDLGLIEKQIKRIAELTEVVTYGPIKTELTDLVRRLRLEAACLRQGLGQHFGTSADKGSLGIANEPNPLGGAQE
jgi:hypothetical protein